MTIFKTIIDYCYIIIFCYSYIYFFYNPQIGSLISMDLRSSHSYLQFFISCFPYVFYDLFCKWSFWSICSPFIFPYIVKSLFLVMYDSYFLFSLIVFHIDFGSFIRTYTYVFIFNFLYTRKCLCFLQYRILRYIILFISYLSIVRIYAYIKHYMLHRKKIYL